MIGATIGAYLVEGELGRGGMGVVYAARHTALNQRVAIKVLLPELSGDPALLDRFFGEAQAAAASRHPGIVQIVDVNRTSSPPYIVMEFLEGESLAARLARAAPLPVADVLAITRQLASALSAAHAAGVIHRDLKPDNVHVVPDPDMPLGERTKVLDFGIAKIATHLAGRGGHTRTGIVMGTPSYMSPEQCRGAGAVDQRSDLYSVGCIVFEMLTGQPPFRGEIGEIIGAHQYRPAPSVRALRPDVPRGLDRLVAHLLAKAPDDRPRSAAALMPMLDELAPRAAAQPRTAPSTIGHPRLQHTTMSAASGEAARPIAVPRRWLRVVAVGGLVASAAVALLVTVPGRGHSSAAAVVTTRPGNDAVGPPADGGPAIVAVPVDGATLAAEVAVAGGTTTAPATLSSDAPLAAPAVGTRRNGPVDNPPDIPPAHRAPHRPDVAGLGATTTDTATAAATVPATPAPPAASAAPPAAPPPAPDELSPIALAEQHARRGDWAVAMQLALGVLRLTPHEPRALVVAALAGCNTQSPSVARTILPRLTVSTARSVRRACAARGYVIPAPPRDTAATPSTRIEDAGPATGAADTPAP